MIKINNVVMPPYETDPAVTINQKLTSTQTPANYLNVTRYGLSYQTRRYKFIDLTRSQAALILGYVNTAQTFIVEEYKEEGTIFLANCFLRVDNLEIKTNLTSFVLEVTESL